ncbi:MAG: inositol monophosphatase family protein [Patescibacteria group bacterium]
MEANDKKYLEVAKEAAKRAGDLLKLRFYQKRVVLERNETGLHLQDDIDSEIIIKKTIRDNFPDHDFLAEESGIEDNPDDYLWIIDPLDGTSNYYFYNPFFCVSIALSRGQQLLLGVVYNPITQEMFWGQKGDGVWLNDKKIEGWPENQVTKSVFGGYTNQTRCQHVLDYTPDLPNNHVKLEMASAELALAYVAVGRLNSYLLDKARIWDVAAGILLIQEAGGAVTNWQGQEWKFDDKQILASNDEVIHNKIIGKINQQMLC